MEALGLLENKIKNLVELATKLQGESAQLKTENSRLIDENCKLSGLVDSLQGQLESFRGSIAENSKNLDEMSQEKALTKMVVDDLIKSIDSLVGENQQ